MRIAAFRVVVATLAATLLGAAAPPARAEAVEAAPLPYTVEVVTDAVDFVWAIAFLPDGSMLVTEKEGRLRRVTRDGVVSAPIAGVPAVVFENQGGLLDVALHPDFATNRWVYFTYARPGKGGSATALARGRLNDAMTALGEVKVLFNQAPRFDGAGHFGSRIAFDGKGHVFVSLGDRQQYPPTPAAQRRGNLLGKVVRLNDDGSVPADNPFVGQPGMRPEIWTYGHRNPQGLAFNPATRSLMEVEHGPLGGDELNVLRRGANYGWPVVSWGTNYDGTPVGIGKPRAPGMANSIRHWTPVIAPGGIAFYTGKAFKGWKNDLLITGLATNALVRLDMKGNKVLREQRFLTERGRRNRAVAVGPDGFIYVGTDESPGEIIRLKPR